MANSRSRAATAWCLAALVTAPGCAGPAIRSQSPEVEALVTLDADTKLVGYYTTPYGTGPLRVEHAALVTGLAGTGGDPPPSSQRQMLLADMQTRGVENPQTLLASPTTSLVWVRGYLPPGVRKGDRFDVSVEVPPDNGTSSLANGWLMETRLAEGPLLVDPVSGGTLDPLSRLRARVPGGGVSTTNRTIGLAITPEHRSVALSKRVGDAINKRFHAVIKGSKRGVATPKTDRFIELEVPPAYARSLAHYIRVVRCVAVVEPPAGRHARLELLARQLDDPVTAPSAAIRLEAVGRDAVPILTAALDSTDAEIRFVAAEALAYLGESSAAPHLAEAAATLRSARPAALAALAVLDDANGIDALQSLLDSPSAETRYGAFRALSHLDPSLPIVRGERLGDACTIHVVDVDGPPLVHLTRSHRPELVLFGTRHPLGDGLRAEAGGSIVVVVADGQATVSRFLPGAEDRVVTVAPTVADVARSIVAVGGTYPDVVQFIQQASSSRSLASRLAFDALPAEGDGRLSIHDEVSTRKPDDEVDTVAVSDES
jgi:hypothetical protein